MSLALVCTVISAILGGTAAGPEISHPHATFGYLGAPRPKMAGMLPGDVGHFSFAIKNLKTDDNGKIAYSIAIVIHDDAGKVLFEQKPYNAFAQTYFGGSVLPAAARVGVPLDAKPGPTHWKVTVTDRTTGKSTSITGKGKVLPADFGLVRVATFADADSQVPAPAVGVVGGNVYLAFGVVGFARDKDTKQPDIKISLRILDDKGQATTRRPLTGEISKDVAADAQYIPMHFGLSLDNVGRYTIELSAHDQVSGRTSAVSLPVRIVAGD